MIVPHLLQTHISVDVVVSSEPAPSDIFCPSPKGGSKVEEPHGTTFDNKKSSVNAMKQQICETKTEIKMTTNNNELNISLQPI